MKYFYYLKLFFFIAFNWNIRLAWFTVYHEIRGEKKYKLDSSKIKNVKKLSIKGNNVEHAELYQGANYYLLEKVFDHLQTIEANQNILDFGCGKGRVLAVAAYYGFRKITGVEFAKELCEVARKNIIPVQQKYPGKIFNVIHVNAVDYKIEYDTNVFFFFNPFNEVVMLAVVKNILASLKQNPREIYVVYLNPVHKEIFMSAGFEQIFHYETLQYIQATIFMLDATSTMG
ncbi:MAG TPA: methyltransferase domain-containing protein [Chitinophagaceae bacterium]|nr:methyltransferase domain-containing protein [Chitinophagaceae bacterium]